MLGPELCAPPARLKLRILPPPCCCIRGQTARVQRKVVRRLLFSSASQSARERSAEGPYLVSPPARFTRISTRPKAATVSSTSLRAPASVVRSAATPIALASGCAAFNSWMRACTRSALRELMATLAPSRTKASARAKPTCPAWLTPVMIATLFARRAAVASLIVHLVGSRLLQAGQRQAAMQHAQAEKRAFQARRTDADAQRVQYIVLAQPDHLVDGAPLDHLGEHRGRCLADRAPASLKTYLRHAVAIDFQINGKLIATERI